MDNIIKISYRYFVCLTLFPSLLACQLIDNSINGKVTLPSVGIGGSPPEVAFSCDDYLEANKIDINGSGLKNDPYVICSAFQLLSLSQTTDIQKLSSHYELGYDLDMAMVSSNFVPIGKLALPFTGGLDGKGFKISNLSLAVTSGIKNIGLFGAIRNATLKDIVVENFTIDAGTSDEVGTLVGGSYGDSLLQKITVINSHISGSGLRIGGLVGMSQGAQDNIYIDADSSINVTNGIQIGGIVGALHCSDSNLGLIYKSQSNASVSGAQYVGGLVGQVGLSDSCFLLNLHPIYVIQSSATGSVTGTGSAIGGLIGESDRVVIKDSWASGPVQGGDEVGGLVGELSPFNTTLDRVIRCYATGDVYGSGTKVGGLVGSSFSDIFDSFASGTVTGDSFVGGLIGHSINRTVRRSYALGAVSGIDGSSSDIGGLVGHISQGIIESSFSTGTLSTGTQLGGIVGYASFLTAINAFWDNESSGLAAMCGFVFSSNCSNLAGKTTVEMKNPSTFNAADPLNWSFYGEVDSEVDHWISKNSAYPQHYWYAADSTVDHPFDGGTGTLPNPYLISTAQQVNSVGSNFTLAKKHFRIVNDIDLSSQNGSYVPWKSFSGSIDGGGYTLSNLIINSPAVDDQGLIGSLDNDHNSYFSSTDIDYITSPIIVKNLNISQFTITGKRGVGALLGGYNNTGLFLGIAPTELVIENVAIELSSVTGTSYVGGLAGACRKIRDLSSTTVVVAGTDYVGGACGRLAESFTNIQIMGAQITLSGSGNRGGGIAGSFSTIGAAGTGSNSSVAGFITGINDIGGLVGTAANLQLSLSSSSTSVTGVSNVGGLIGSTSGNILIERSFVTLGSIDAATSADSVGGFVGAVLLDELSITNSYVFTPINADGVKIGGFVGRTEAPLILINNYMAATLTISGTSLGGLIGAETDILQTSLQGNIWNSVDNSGISFAGDGRTSLLSNTHGVSLIELKLKSTYTAHDWDFLNIWKFNPAVNSSFPSL